MSSSIIVYPKEYFGNSVSGRDRQYKWFKKLMKFSSEKIRILPSQSRKSDPIHALDYGRVMSVKNATNKEFFGRFSSCGCGFEYRGDNKKFIDFIENMEIKKVSNIALSSSEINKKKALVGSQVKPHNSEEIEELIEKDFFKVNKENKTYELATGFAFISRARKKENIINDAKKALKQSTPKVGKIVAKLTAFYSVDLVTNNILLRKTIANTIKGSIYEERYLLYSNKEKEILAITSVFNKKNKEVSTSITSFDDLKANDKLKLSYQKHYKNFKPKEVIQKWVKTTK